MSHIILPDAYPCAFCEYLSGARSFTILHRERDAAILVTREQRGYSHLLVVTTRHVPTILELRESEASAVMNLIRRAAIAIDAVDMRPGISIWQNNGVDAHQAIPHLHFHIAGTIDGGSTDWHDDVPELSIAQTDAIADKLRPNF